MYKYIGLKELCNCVLLCKFSPKVYPLIALVSSWGILTSGTTRWKLSSFACRNYCMLHFLVVMIHLVAVYPFVVDQEQEKNILMVNINGKSVSLYPRPILMLCTYLRSLNNKTNCYSLILRNNNKKSWSQLPLVKKPKKFSCFIHKRLCKIKYGTGFF